MNRTRADVAKSAGHTHAIGLCEIWILVVILVGVIFLGIPSVLRRLVKIRIGKQSQADNARRISEIRADRQLGAVGEGRAAGADLDARIGLLILEWVRRRGFVEARFIDRAQPVPARVAIAMFAVAIGLARM